MVICDCELMFLASAFMETKGKEERERKNEEHSLAWKSSVLRLRGRQKWFSGGVRNTVGRVGVCPLLVAAEWCREQHVRMEPRAASFSALC